MGFGSLISFVECYWGLIPDRTGSQILCVRFQATLVRNREFPAACFAAAGQNFAAIFRFHARAKTVFVAALSPRGLVCTFHRLLCIKLFCPKNGAQR
jgi:hypothetical protein